MSAAPQRRSLVETIIERLKHFEVPPSLERPLRIFGYPVFALVVLLMSFAAALPSDKIKERLEYLLSQDPTPSQPMGLGVDVKAGELSLSVLSRGIVAQNVVLRTRPMRMGDKPSRFVLDTVRLNIGLIALALQRPTYAFTISAFEGVIEGAIKVSLTDAHYNVEGSGLSLGAVQGLQNAVSGLPIEGKVEGKFELDAPGRLLGTADGSLDITIENASLGDGKAKLVIASDPFLSQGLTMPRIRLGKIAANIVIEKGKARIDALQAHSADMDITIEGTIDLRDPAPLSQLHLYLRFKLSDELLKKEPTLGLVTTSLAAGKRPDGFFGAQITGSLASPAFVPNVAPPPGVVSKITGVVPPPPTTTTTVTPAPAPTVPPPALSPIVDAATSAGDPPKPPPRLDLPGATPGEPVVPTTPAPAPAPAPGPDPQ